MARIRLAKIAGSDTPPTGQVAVYAKTNNKLYYKDDLGIEYEILAGTTPSGGGYEVEYFTVSAAQALAKEIELSGTPSNPNKTLMDIANGGGPQIYALDFSVSSNIVSWDGTRLDGILGEGDEVRIIWF